MVADWTGGGRFRDCAGGYRVEREETSVSKSTYTNRHKEMRRGGGKGGGAEVEQLCAQ